MKSELREIKKNYAVPRKTEIRDEIVDIKVDAKEMIPDEKVIVVVTNEGYVKRVSQKSFKTSEEETKAKRQARSFVSKQIIFQKGADRMQSRLESLSSNLIYSKQEGELVEHFQDLTCNIQDNIHSLAKEDLFPISPPASGSIIKQFKAKEAVYSYKTGLLEARHVEIFHFLLPVN